MIWDPNPYLKDIDLGTAEVIHWKDDTGYEWKAGLVKPPDYTPGKRYPLVIQTHGFAESQFLSSGIFTTAFAARALAAQEIVVLQMDWNFNNFDTPKEGPDQVAGFESVVKKLTDDGVIDPARVGVIGFSRSVYHVLVAITTAKHLFAAASVTDGMTFGYFEYLLSVDSARRGSRRNQRRQAVRRRGPEKLARTLARIQHGQSTDAAAAVAAGCASGVCGLGAVCHAALPQKAGGPHHVASWLPRYDKPYAAPGFRDQQCGLVQVLAQRRRRSRSCKGRAIPSLA